MSDSKSNDSLHLNRREILRNGVMLTGALSLPFGLSACGLPTRAVGSFEEEGVLIGSYDTDGETAVLEMLSHLDFGWLKEGDSVFLKLASNSSEPHPATTSVSVVRALVKYLLEAGATVIVGDQAGVEAVRLASGNKRYHSSRKVMETNGLLQAIEESGGIAEFFDERDYDEGYFSATLPKDSYWSEDMKIAEVIREVDHIIYLPRISSHALAGYTHGHKIAVGWLRDDSRYHFHHKAEFFHEKYVDINYCDEIADRLRLTITLAESVLLYDGPDRGTVVELDQPLVIASSNLANHDAVSVAVLSHYADLNKRSSGTDAVPYGQFANAVNFGFLSMVKSWTGIPWGEGVLGYEPFSPHNYKRGIPKDRALRRAYFLQGGVPEYIPVRVAGDNLPASLLTALEEYSQGQLEMEPS